MFFNRNTISFRRMLIHVMNVFNCFVCDKLATKKTIFLCPDYLGLERFSYFQFYFHATPKVHFLYDFSLKYYTSQTKNILKFFHTHPLTHNNLLDN